MTGRRLMRQPLCFVLVLSEETNLPVGTARCGLAPLQLGGVEYEYMCAR